ncbi:MAG: hypothetical protein KJP04_08010 [Arenicella sp.]|nr:hypothetical protein [Arenicella sp.]
MNWLKPGLMLLVILVINNMALLYWLGYFDQQGADQLSESTNTSLLSSSNNRSAEQQLREEIWLETEIQESTAQAQAPLNQQAKFINQLRTAANSGAINDILDEWQMGAVRRYEDSQKRLALMDAADLYNAVVNGSKATEKQLAMQLLMQGKSHDLDTTDLKTLFQDESLHHWNRMRLLKILLERDDIESVAWARQLITNDDGINYLDQDFISMVHEKDPDFIREHLKTLSLESHANPQSFFAFLSEEPKLRLEFLQNRFDDILESTNWNLHQHSLISKDFEMTSLQQSKLLEFFESPSRRKRRFAMGYIGNIDNVDDLRRAYASLELPREQVRFVTMLVGDSSDSQQQKLALAREIANTSDNPKIQRLTQSQRVSDSLQ